MRLLIDIGHPAHVHYFRNLARIFIDKGEEVLFTTRDKEVAVLLLDHYAFTYVNFGKPFKNRLGKAWGLFWFSWRTLRVALKFKPDIYLNASIYNALVARLFRKPHISLEDTFNMEQVRLYLPFTSVVLTGEYDHPNLGRKQLCYPGYQELAYLHPAHFSPDACILNVLGIAVGERYVILRFVAWKASHDYGHSGIDLANKRRAVEEFSKSARVFISAEAELPPDLEEHRLRIPPEKIHDVLAFAHFIFSESATMVSEAAVLGVPGIYIDSTGRYYTRDQEKHGMVFNFTESLEDQDRAIKKGVELLRIKDTRRVFRSCHEQMMSNKIDVTAFLDWFVSEYPLSKETMKRDPRCFDRFKTFNEVLIIDDLQPR